MVIFAKDEDAIVLTSDFDFDLPEGLIAQHPLPERSDSRMMVLRRDAGTIEHAHIGDLPGILASGDLLVVNNTRVIPARLFGERVDTGGRVELLLVERVDEEGCCWEAMYKASGRAREGLELRFADGDLKGTIREKRDGGRVLVRFESRRPLLEVLETHGVPPLPPYIRRDPGNDLYRADDVVRYQTVYAEHAGAVAAPTAGLHFSSELIERCEQTGIGMAQLTLHVGPGTFKPVKADRVVDHQMEPEAYCIDEAAAEAIHAVDRAQNRIVAVGSTSVRTLETVAVERGQIEPCEGRSALFIYPPYQFRAVDAMLTNFHLPKSTLIMMVAALAGKEYVLDAYRQAVDEKYRFYSYGDCMLIL